MAVDWAHVDAIERDFDQCSAELDAWIATWSARDPIARLSALAAVLATGLERQLEQAPETLPQLVGLAQLPSRGLTSILDALRAAAAGPRQ